MNDSQNANIAWVAMALTAPEYANERYYYDELTELFFYKRITGFNNFSLYSFLDFPLSAAESADVSKRLQRIGDTDCGIVEIPRLSVLEKIEIQLDFLSQFYRVYQLNELIAAVEDQRDDYRMVLDNVLLQHANAATMTPLWNDFKLKVVFRFIKHFTSAIGVQVSFA
jgi:hypothetical protein